VTDFSRNDKVEGCVKVFGDDGTDRDTTPRECVDNAFLVFVLLEFPG
jgi:hypothetical protein